MEGKKGSKTYSLARFDELLRAIRKCSIFSPVWQESVVLVIPIVNRIAVGATNILRFWE